jgi:hypothetical protein
MAKATMAGARKRNGIERNAASSKNGGNMANVENGSAAIWRINGAL